MDYINKAMEAINHYEDSEPKNMLKEISQFIVERSK
jgi:geranylgeranyl pyrophosphate synthase